MRDGASRSPLRYVWRTVIDAADLAGFFAAHCIWSIADAKGDGPSFHPVLAHVGEDGGRKMERFVVDDLERAVNEGRKRLDANAMDANAAVFAYDGRITVGSEKLDAILLEMRVYFSPSSKALIAVPYTPPSRGGLRVHRPKLLQWEDCDDFATDALFEAFWAGVDQHEQGAKLWNAHIDPSK